VLNVATQRRPRRPRRRTQPSWEAPVYRVIRQVNHEALRWQIAQALSELAPSDWEAIRADHEMESDAVIELYMQIYDRLTHPFRADIEFDCPLDQAFDAELRRQIAVLLSAEVIAA
jgi:hypothetical protein